MRAGLSGLAMEEAKTSEAVAWRLAW